MSTRTHLRNLRAQIKRSILLFASLTFVVCISVFNSHGQKCPPPRQATSDERDETKPGRLLSQGVNRTPSGDLKVLTYTLEELKPFSNEPPDKIKEMPKPLRLSVTTEAKLNGSYRIWIGENSVEAFQQECNKLTVILYTSKLPNGARLAVSRSFHPDDTKSVSVFSYLPELLTVPPPYAGDADPTSYTLRKADGFSYELKQKVPGVEIEIQGQSEFHIGALAHVVFIGSTGYVAFPRGNTLVVWFSAEDFAKLTDGSVIRISYGSPDTRPEYASFVGRLNKSLLQ